MAITTLLEINGDILPKIKGYKVQRNKLWTNAGRNMAGSLRSDFIGIFPKILVEFGYTTAEEIEDIIALLDEPSFSVQYWNPAIQTTSTGTYYAGDYDIPLFDKLKELYAPFSVNLIPYEKE